MEIKQDKPHVKSKWSDYTLAEQNNLGTMETVMVTAKKIFGDEYRTNPIFKASMKRVEVLRGKADRAAKKAAAENTEQMQTEYYEKSVDAIMNETDYFYISNQAMYAIWSNNRWEYITERALLKMHPVLNNSEASAMFDEAMFEKGRVMLSSTYSFRSVSDDCLNLMKRDNWLEPKAGEYHPYFDVLLDSLSSGKQENREHLERVIAWKYKYPEDFLLPCITIYGDGAVGKGILLEAVFGNIFTDEQCIAVRQNDILGNFNSVIMGKTIVMIDEISANNKDMAAFKAFVGNKTITVNPKGLKQFKADQTALVFTGSNDVLSAVRLAGDNSDRRWSILKITAGKTLRYWMDRHGYKTATEEDLVDVVSDHEELSKWLFHICKQSKGLARPIALHGEDYKQLIQNQKSELEELCERVFNDSEFTGIKEMDLWWLYQLKMGAESKWTGRGKRPTMVQVRNWVEKNAKHVVFKEMKQVEIDGAKKAVKSIFILKDADAGMRPVLKKKFLDTIAEELHDDMECNS